jgi:hypothetical protein
MRQASKKRTLCEVLREINDIHQSLDNKDVETRRLLVEAQGMAKKIVNKLFEYSKQYHYKYWKENPDHAADVRRRLGKDYLVG